VTCILLQRNINFTAFKTAAARWCNNRRLFC
jgi:hypothetical protein